MPPERQFATQSTVGQPPDRREICIQLRDTGNLSTGDDRQRVIFEHHQGVITLNMVVLAVETRADQDRAQPVAPSGHEVYAVVIRKGERNNRRTRRSETLRQHGRNRLKRARVLNGDHLAPAVMVLRTIVHGT